MLRFTRGVLCPFLFSVFFFLNAGLLGVNWQWARCRLLWSTHAEGLRIEHGHQSQRV